MHTAPLVSILVLNFNGKHFLKACFDSLLKCTYVNFEIILVDNNSTDGSVVFTEQHYRQVKILQTGKNGGYSRAYNLAMEQAEGKYAILLNNDVEVPPDWLEPLVNAAESDAQIGALQPKILSLIDEGYFEYAGASGGFIDRYGYPFLRGRVFFTIEKDEGQYDDETEVFWTSGAAMFVRLSVLKKTGNLDEDFVHHMEEIDLCWRLQMAGYRLKVIPSSVIYHYAGATIKPDSFMKMYWNHRNGIFMLLKNLERKNLLKVLSVRFFLDFINIFFAAFAKFNFKHAYAIIKAYFWIFTNLNLIFSSRKQVQARRLINDDQIMSKIYQNSIVFEYFIKGHKTFNRFSYSAQFDTDDILTEMT